MALKIQARYFKYLIAAAGLLGLSLRAVLYTVGVDQKGLLIAGHGAGTGIFLLTAAVAAALIWWSRPLTGPKNYANAFPASFAAAGGAALAGIAFLFCGVPEAPSAAIAFVEPVLRYAAGAALIFTGYCRLSGRRPAFLFRCCVGLYLALRLICQYRIWSVDPQLHNYCFYLGAHIALMLTAYQLAAFDAGAGNHRSLWVSGLAAIYLCAVSLIPSPEPGFLICCILWIWTNLSNLNPRKHAKYETPHPTKQEDSI